MVDCAANRYAHRFERDLDLGCRIDDPTIDHERNLHRTLDRQQSPSRHAGGKEFSGCVQDIERNNLPGIIDSGYCCNTILGFARGRSIRGVRAVDWGNIQHFGDLVAEPARWYNHKRSLYGTGGNQHITDNPPHGGELGGPIKNRASFDYAQTLGADVDQRQSHTNYAGTFRDKPVYCDHSGRNGSSRVVHQPERGEHQPERALHGARRAIRTTGRYY